MSRNGAWHLVVDGSETEGFDDIVEVSVTFSPNSRRLAYVAARGNLFQVVLDGVGGKLYQGILSDSVVFSPNSEGLAYLAFDATRKHLE